MTEPKKIYALIHAIRYVVKAKIKGSLVECDVWRDGPMMAVALTLLGLGERSRDLYLYDTYEGIPLPLKKTYLLYLKRML